MSWKTAVPGIGMILCLATPLAAQRPTAKPVPPPPPPAMTVDFDAALGFWTSYIDRGVVLGNIPVLQPQLTAAIRSPNHSVVTFGLLTTLEVAKPSDSTRFGFAADTIKRPALVEVRPSLTFAQDFGKVTVDVGGFYRLFMAKAGITSAGNYGGFSAGLSFPKFPLPLRVGAVYDIGAIQGPRGEAEIMRPIPLAPGAALLLGARAGWAFNQKVTATAPVALQRFARDGFTNLDLVGGVNLTIAGAKVRPRVEIIYARDTSLVAVGTPASTQYRWLARFGASIGFGGTFPKAVAPPPPAPAPVRKR